MSINDQGEKCDECGHYGKAYEGYCVVPALGPSAIACRCSRCHPADSSQDGEQELDEWSDCELAVDEGRATALQQFIYNNEPGDYAEAKLWRTQLAAALATRVHLSLQAGLSLCAECGSPMSKWCPRCVRQPHFNFAGRESLPSQAAEGQQADRFAEGVRAAVKAGEEVLENGGYAEQVVEAIRSLIPTTLNLEPSVKTCPTCTAPTTRTVSESDGDNTWCTNASCDWSLTPIPTTTDRGEVNE